MTRTTKQKHHGTLPKDDSQLTRESWKIFQIMAEFVEGFERLAIIPNRDPIENSSDLIASPRMHELIAWTREQETTSVTIFDMPPVLVSDDVIAFIDYVDATLVVVTQGKTDRRALEKVVDLLGENEILGIVLNRSSHIVGQDHYSYY